MAREAGRQTRESETSDPILYYQSRYAERLRSATGRHPHCPVERLRHSTTRGTARTDGGDRGRDVEPQQIEDAIKSTFERSRRRPRRRPCRQLYRTASPADARHVVTDSELTRSSVQSCGSGRRDAVARSPITGRSRAAHGRAHVSTTGSASSLEAGCEVSRAGVSDGAPQPGRLDISVAAGVQDGKLEDGANAIAVEAKRVREYGFSSSELNRAKQWTAAFYERAYNERDKTESGSFRTGMPQLFSGGRADTWHRLRYALVQQVLPGIAPPTPRRWLKACWRTPAASSWRCRLRSPTFPFPPTSSCRRRSPRRNARRSRRGTIRR